MWPQLPETGFIAGRPATESDIAAGNAVFVLRSGDLAVGEPLEFEIPQYVHHVDENGTRTPGVLIQAEGVGDKRLVGVRYFDGTVSVALLSELELLGLRAPA